MEDLLFSPEPTSQWIQGANLQPGAENIKSCVCLITVANAGSFQLRKVAVNLAAAKQKCEENCPNIQTAHLVT